MPGSVDVSVPTGRQDVLSVPTRARLLAELVRLRRPAAVDELATRLDVHPNCVRQHAARLEAAGLVERHVVTGGRGRPRHEWAVAPDGEPGGHLPEAYADLSRWLARLVQVGATDDVQVDAIGREIGRELAPEHADGDVAAALRSALAALGFRPHAADEADGVHLALENCPYREVAAERPEVVCRLHRAITTGLVRALAPGAEVASFVAADPRDGGCSLTLTR
jgi:predicted ArsR family transcriptional regulator